MPIHNNQQLAVHILSKNPLDSDLTKKVLKNAKINSLISESAEDLCENIADAGALIISEEVLSLDGLELLKSALERQPIWSDIPVILVTAIKKDNFDIDRRINWISQYISNFTLLEKPIRIVTLISVVRSALFSRKRQFEQYQTLIELEKVRKQAVAANQAKTSFLANISHEIRTPLSVINGYLEILQLGQHSPEDIKEYISIIEKNGKQLTALVNDVLDLSKIESGIVETQSIGFKLKPFLQQVIEHYSPSAKQKNLTIELKIDENIPSSITSDKNKIRQILVNLLTNAIKFTSQGTIELIVSAQKIDDKQSKLFFKVTDQGIGVSSENQKKLFKPFSQADDSITRRYGGSGLGLALSKRLAQALGGDLILEESAQGEGSTFIFSMIAFTNNKVKISSTNKNNHQSISLKGKKILIVDDQKENRRLFEIFLTSVDAETKNAENGQEAIDLILSHQFDLIFMDIQMPVMDGLTATQTLRSQKINIPIIAISAHAMTEHINESLKHGFDDHLTKPISRNTLIESAYSHLHKLSLE